MWEAEKSEKSENSAALVFVGDESPLRSEQWVHAAHGSVPRRARAASWRGKSPRTREICGKLLKSSPTGRYGRRDSHSERAIDARGFRERLRGASRLRGGRRARDSAGGPRPWQVPAVAVVTPTSKSSGNSVGHSPSGGGEGRCRCMAGGAGGAGDCVSGAHRGGSWAPTTCERRGGRHTHAACAVLISGDEITERYYKLPRGGPRGLADADDDRVSRRVYAAPPPPAADVVPASGTSGAGAASSPAGSDSSSSAATRRRALTP